MRQTARRMARRADGAIHALGVLLLGAAMTCAAQEPALTALRAAYAGALDRWERADPTLEAELFRKPAAEMLARIDAAARLRDDVGRAKLAYLNGLSHAYRSAAVQLRAPAPPPLKRPADTSAMLTEIARVIDGLNTDIRRNGAKNPEMLAALQRQKTNLLELQLLLSDRQRKIEAIRAEPRATDGAAAAASLSATASSIDAQKERVAAESKAWADLYATMREEVQRRAAESASGAAAVGATSPPISPSVPAVQVVPETGAVVPNLAGEWSATTPSAVQAETLLVRIRQTGDHIQGAYEAIYPAGAKEAQKTAGVFQFEGRITSDFMRFTLKAPLKGWVVLQRVNTGRLRLSYRVERASSHGIRTGEIAQDSPIELVRQGN